MQWMLLICSSIWIYSQSIECHPTVQPTVTKPLKGDKGQQELVYPKLHLVDHPKIKFSDSNSFPVVVLRTSIETFYIELKPNEDLLKPNASEELGENSRKNCHYHGKILSHPDGVAAISICEYGNRMTGTIMVRDGAFTLRPLDHLENGYLHLQNISSSRGVHPHVISKVESPLTQYCGVDRDENAHRLDGNEIDSHFRHRRSDAEDTEDSKVEHKVIETSIFVDYPLYHKYTVEKRKLQSELIDTVLAIINQVQIIYNYDPLKIKFKIVVVKLEILLAGKDAPDSADGDIDAYLDNFCSWQSYKNFPEGDVKHWDHSIMLSGHDLHKLTDGKRNKKVLGLAWINGMCRPKHSCTLNEGSNFEAAFVIAHEMGHSLGMRHDGQGNDCDPSAFLMAEKTGPGRMTWSKCSNEYLQKFFQNGRGKCLEDADTNFVDSSRFKLDDDLPGSHFDLDAQCKLSLGDSYRPQVMAKPPFDNVCRELWCVSGFWASVAHPALEGSICGNGGKCIQGKCNGRKPDIVSHNDNSVVRMQKMIIDFMDRLKTAFQLLLP